ncbi:hypothetical protein FRC17_000468, partial [Serendipita sp. 399]
MSTSRVPRPRTTSSTPRKPLATPASTTSSSTTSRGTPVTRAARGGLAAPTLRTKTSASRLQPTTPRSNAKSLPSQAVENPPSPVSPRAISIKEQIALRRAEQAKKASSSKNGSHDGIEEGSVPNSPSPVEEDILGRWSIRDTIDRAKSSGSILLASRDLTRIPSYLFESHLSLTPQPLKEAPPEVVEPDAPPKQRRTGKTTWYEQVDLTAIKAWDNAIVEIQPEISLFGSLKIVDLHKNKLRRLPDSFMDLVFLVNLDLSENELEELPDQLASLPNLANLNVSHNKLRTLPFEIKENLSLRTRSESFFSVTIERAKVPLPSLMLLNASHNMLTPKAVHLPSLPRGLVDVDLSHNELSKASSLITAIAKLAHIRTLKLASCSLTNESFPSRLTPSRSLHHLDLGENDAMSEAAVRHALQDVEMEIGPTHTHIQGILNVTFGKPGPVLEDWEIEAERRARQRKTSATSESVFSVRSETSKVGSRRPSLQTSASAKSRSVAVSPPPPPVKEGWEIEAEQGLLTEGGRRRARAAAAAAKAVAHAVSDDHGVSQISSGVSSLSISSGSSSSSLIQFYDGPHATLTLPRSQPQPRTHNRSFSVVPSSASTNASELTVPLPTLPLPSILSQSFASSIKVLVLSSRKMETTFVLPSTGLSDPVLPHLEELSLDSCNLASEVPVSQESSTTPSMPKESLLHVIASLFPTLSTLDLSYNALTTLAGVGVLFTPDAEKKRKGLTTLRVRGNRLVSLEPLEEVASQWKGSGGIPGWRGEEIDLRDNEIGRLPPLLGLLPLEVLLVEGNTFRVPNRRIWEKD